MAARATRRLLPGRIRAAWYTIDARVIRIGSALLFAIAGALGLLGAPAG